VRAQWRPLPLLRDTTKQAGQGSKQRAQTQAHTPRHKPSDDYANAQQSTAQKKA
jgi:hypothetical protein